MTQAEQATEMNSPSFFGASGAKIIAAKDAIANADVQVTDGCITHLNGVQIWWIENDDLTTLRYGVGDDGSPIYQITIPTQWLAVSI